MVLSWKDKLQHALTKAHGSKKGAELFKKYADFFTTSYCDTQSPDMAVNDIDNMEKISADQPLQTFFYFSESRTDHPLHLRLYQWERSIPLCHSLPMLENFDLRALEENPYQIILSNNQHIWISDYTVDYALPDFDIKNAKALFQDAFTRIHAGQVENDGLNKLILGASLSWREVTILRACTKYLRQAGFRFSQLYIEKALSNNIAIAQHLVELFLALHDPAKQSKSQAIAELTEQSIYQALESVASLDEDRIIRHLLELIKAILRTNYFQTTETGEQKEYLSIKLNSGAIPELPLPVPLYEIFVYSPRFEAIHLRSDRIARGGIRWSDRREDFRTEVLGLMKAQKVKNSVIVPSGAKGGFVLKMLPAHATREMTQVEVVHCYKSFIRGLLDLTDNIKDKKFIRPKQVVCLDEPDAYLVVAADKGTATFSDIANSISMEYQFWLGDAFASGGSAGYDHKKMGITARGAWESVKRHFRELDVDVQNTNITVVGVGDMSGDVFGNGMIYSKHLKLVGAFDHRHIFIDPSPDPEISYAERVRLFNLPASSWEDYNAKLISKGGGVFKRSVKSITLTPQIKQILDIADNTLTPNELIRAILQAPVDLLFNGGIGTYVKASTESQADVGDRTNEFCRVNGKELRCKVVGEGGNLGFTQLGRVEYALKGGYINTDFIDNSAGVDCSDHEVNLKILFNADSHHKKLVTEKRDQLLASMTSEVADLVLNDNYLQAWVMSFSSSHSVKNIGLHMSYIQDLVNLGVLNREVEFLPDDKKLAERKAQNQGLTRPELAVLLAYTKIYIKNEILASDLPENPLLSQVLDTAFPASIRAKYKKALDEHMLHRNIIATQLSNQLVNEMGITFVYRLQMETGCSVAEIVKAHAVASRIFNSVALKSLIESLDFKVKASQQFEMLYNLRNLISLASRWFLRSTLLKGDLQDLISHYSPRVATLENIIPDLMSGKTKVYLNDLTEQFAKAGLSKDIARRISTYRAIYTTLNIIMVSSKYNFDLQKTAHIYFHAGEKVNLLWFRDQILTDSREGHWNVLARLSLRDDLDISQRDLTIAIMKHDKKGVKPEALIENWMKTNEIPLQRWDKLMTMLCESTNVEYTMYFIAIRELSNLILASQ